MHTMIRRIRKLKIEKRLRTFFFLASIVPVLILGICSAVRSYEEMKGMAVEYSAAMADISSGNMEQHFSKYISQIEAVEENETLLRQLSVYSSADWDEKKKTENEMRLLINSIFGQNQEVDTVEISSADGAKFYYPSPVTQKESPLLARTKASEGPLWSFIPKEIGTDRENYIVISKTMEPYGNIVLALKKDYAETLCQNAGAGKQWKTAIFDGSGVLVAGENAFDRMSGEKGNITSTDQGRMFTSGHVITAMQWKIVNGVPYSYLLGGVYQQTAVLVVLLAAGLLVVFFLSRIMTASITEPLGRLTRAMERDGWSELLTDGGRDEYHELIRGFNRMNERLGHMGNEVLQMELKESRLERIKKETELSALQKQINPHFLYNTLDSIRWIAVIQKNSGIVKMVTALSGLLKNMAKGFNEKVTLQKELDFLGDYVTIEKVKYVELFDLEVRVDEPELYEALVIKLTLQPLVENAIFNGIEPGGKHGTILIHAYRQGDVFIIKVRDNGVGIAREKMASILNHTEKVKGSSMSGIGLPNVDRRIKLNYGEEYGLTIESQEGEFTEITIKMPLEYECEGESR